MKIKILSFLILALLLPSVSSAETGARPETVVEDVQPQLQPTVVSRPFGTILPLTGKYSKLGERSLRGIRTAIEQTDQFGSYHVFVKDSKSTSEGASIAYRQLTSEITPLFVIGPVPSTHVSGIENSNPVISQPVAIFPIFNNKAHRNNIISFYLPMDYQVKTLADFSLRDLKLKKFAVLSPDTGVGDLYSSKFSKYLKRNGGKIVYSGSYNPDLSDLDTHIKWLESYKLDAIFIPDSAKNSTFVIKHIISDDDITNVIFLGPNTWNSEIFYNLSKNDFDGIVHKIIFTDFIDKNSEDWINFSNLYRTLFNERPGSYEYQVYLATLFFLEKDLRREIVSSNNSLTPKAHILTIDDGRIVRLK